MLRVTSIGAENLRSLENTGLIKLKPITILVGRNSSGKSTFARLFPLLKQSAEAVKKGPLLWWGRLVDFGSFDVAVSRQVTDKTITVNFEFEASPEEFRSMSRRHDGRLSMVRLVSSGTVVIRATMRDGKNSTYVSKIELDAFGNNAKVEIDEFGFAKSITSGNYVWQRDSSIAFFAEQSTLIPVPQCYKAVPGEKDDFKYWEMHNVFRPEQSRLLRNFLHGNTAEEKVRQLADRIPIGYREDIFQTLSHVTRPPSFRDNLLAQGFDGYYFQRLCDVSFAAHLAPILEQANLCLSRFAEEVIYLEPLRANAQRYYRQQALAVGEIDSKGENIAMFLDNLSWPELHNLNAWLEEHFGFKVKPSKQGGHVSLKIEQTGGGETNIADMGFGFSQMLPIAVQLWAASKRKSKSTPWNTDTTCPTLVIEQPELHLHPDYQAKLGDVFAAALDLKREDDGLPANASRLSIIAETHSADLINRLGALIADGRLSSEDVQVIVFEQADSTSPSKLRISEFDDDGILTNWPMGFFTPSVYA
ncbi:MAG: DUF3696 domain-containing protein [Rubrivivax sp.]|nr:MAG: DUF3696 domain-containing protein [Rubrivivax sp.]